MCPLYEVKKIGQGKLYMAAELYNRYSTERFFAFDANGEIILIPRPADPVKALQALLKHEQRTPRQVRQQIARYAQTEAKHAVRRH